MAQKPTEWQVFWYFVKRYKEFPIMMAIATVPCIVMMVLQGILWGVVVFSSILLIYVPIICIVVYVMKRKLIWMMYQGQPMVEKLKAEGMAVLDESCLNPANRRGQ